MSRNILFFATVLLTTLAVALPAIKGSRAAAQDKEPPKKSSGDTGDQDKAAPAGVVVKRQSEATDEDLRKQLLTVPETGFGQREATSVYGAIGKNGVITATNLPADLGPNQFKLLTVQVKRPEQFGLPWRMEPDCTMGKESAERLHVLSLRLRDCLRQATPNDDVRPDPEKLHTLLFADAKAKEWKTAAAIPTLMQLLQVENTPVRLLLVDLLGDIDGKEASVALAQRALFDLSPEVRERAVQTLAKRPAAQYQQVLLDGLRYPWPPAAVHASEAITALKLTPVMPDLVNLLKEPDPALPVKKNENQYILKEVVRVNHLCNCLLCHAPSQSKEDLIRGRIPVPGEDPPPLYYNATSGMFVRANTTYLRQDFSVVQPVADNGKWPTNQRYDYVLRTRPLSVAEVRTYQQLETPGARAKSYPQREAVLSTLRGVTKVDAGDTYELWAQKLKDLPVAPYPDK